MKSMWRHSAAAFVALVIPCRAAPLALNMTDQYAFERNAERVTVGGVYEDISRETETAANVGSVLNACAASAVYGYDVRPWLTLHGRAGLVYDAVDTDVAGPTIGVGGAAQLHQWPLHAPQMLEGDSFNMRAVADLTYANMDYKTTTVEWQEYTAALTFGYERTERDARLAPDELFSLAFYAGPLLSVLTGDRKTGSATSSFNQEDTFGALVGCEINMTRHVQAAVQAHVFGLHGDAGAVNAGLRYHF